MRIKTLIFIMAINHLTGSAPFTDDKEAPKGRPPLPMSVPTVRPEDSKHKKMPVPPIKGMPLPTPTKPLTKDKK